MWCRLYFAALCFLVVCLCVEKSTAFTSVSRHSKLRQYSADRGSTLSTPTPPSLPRDTSLLLATRRVDDFDGGGDDDEEKARIERELAALEQSMNRNRGTRAVGPGRAGGRKTRKSVTAKPQSNSPWNNWVVKAGVPALAIALFLKSLFGGGEAASNASPSYFYYQSSYYESRVYRGDGNMERTYKQSIKSNVPSLIEGRRLLREDTRPTESEPSGTSQYLLQESPDRGLDQELDAALIKVQQAMFSDWY